jgi:TRAP-type mannitol/chloroaromatic compound transport system substrate-binding protein
MATMLTLIFSFIDRIFTELILSLIIVLLVCFGFTVGESKAARNYKMQLAYSSSIPMLGSLGSRFCDKISKISAGKITFTPYSPGAIVAPNEIVDAISRRVIEAGFSSPTYTYFKIKDETLMIFGGFPFGPEAAEHWKWMKEGGGNELLDRLYAKYGLKSIPCGYLTEEGIWFRKPVYKLRDLQGLKVRASSSVLQKKVFEKLGMQSIRMPAAEVFSALQRGVIDAADFSTPYIDVNWKLYETAKYYYYPGWQQPFTMLELLINKKVWDSLNPKERGLIQKVCEENVEFSLRFGPQMIEDGLKTFKKYGTEIKTFPNSISTKAKSIWLELAADYSAESSSFRMAYNSLTDFLIKTPFDPEKFIAEIIERTYVTMTGVGVYERPDVLSKLQAELAQGTRIHVRGRGVVNGEDWYLITKDQETIGYILAKRLKPVSESSGQKGPVFGTPIAPGNQQTIKPYMKKQAIIIGISDYKDLKSVQEETIKGKLTDLAFAEKDAKDISAFFGHDQRSGNDWKIHELIGPNASTNRIKSTIADVLDAASEDDLIYIFFSGHARRSPSDPNEVYLLTQDFKYNEGYSGIWYGWLKSKIASSRARNIIAFVDACRSGTVGFARGSSPPDQELIGEIKGLQGFKAIFTSGRGSEISYEDENLKNGVFTYYLLKGFKGEAENRDKDQFVDLVELENYVIHMVKKHTANHKEMNTQRPFLWPAYGLNPEEFPIALRTN